ncbi:iron ABC transporter permease [Caulobacter sp. 17J80-11]|uniref:ABC transporter permease n=1 Tax=Caulobacter sp. 17J80-11 TaxID=2763502 RepID=UPI001653E37D|nr:iron ABC transporter permease [Caulobacter sp. 17J80-11]MBC6983472.1 iron ABC transporter permease [Caulobacter sp. 17J80-11]
MADVQPLSPTRLRRLSKPWTGLQWGALVAAVLAITPLVAVIALAVFGGEARASAPELIARYALNSAVLAALVALGAGSAGALAAWLVVMHRFPGRSFFAWALALPLAAPAFLLAYAYADLFDAAGPIRTAFRAAFGTELPLNMRSLPGAAFVLSAAFYPYVYLTARTAFVNQSVAALEAARTLGCSLRQAFFRVALPLARPALAAGMALAVMETLADYGAVNFLSVQTLTTGVVRAWSVFGSTVAAARLSLLLMGAAAVLLMIERANRKGAGHDSGAARWRALPTLELKGASAWGASLFCLTLLTLGLLLPAGWLAWRGLSAVPEAPRLLLAAAHSLSLSLAGAAVTVVLAAVIAFGARGHPLAPRLASLGYATPGAVMAIGLLAPAGWLWRGFEGAVSGFGAGVGLLLYAYAARLMASALEPIDAGLSRITPSMGRAARTLGETETGAVRRVHLPIAKGALLTAALLVFVDVLKELPATLILRPFNFDTLAVLADNYAADERLAQAAWPALLILLVAIGPVIVLTRRVAHSRPGAPS